MSERVPPTRLGLMRTRARLERVHRGVELLRRKREALVGELFRAARPAVDARREIDLLAAEAHAALRRALAEHGLDGLDAMGRPPRDLSVDLEVDRVWGVPVARVHATSPVRRTLEARGTMPGAWGPAAVEAADRYERLVERILDAAPRELLVRALGQALSRTTRQLNTLEQAVAPVLAARARSIARGLDEREREDHLRLRRLVHRRPR